MLTIYKFNGEVRADIHPTDNSQQVRKLMAEDVVNLSFNYTSSIPLTIGDYINFDGVKYTLNQLPTEVKNSKYSFDYEMTFEAPFMDLSKVLLLGYDSQNNLSLTDFSVMGNAEVIISLIIANIVRVYPGWQPGLIAETVTKNVSFSSDNCLSALGKLAQEMDNEYFFSGTGKTINFYRNQTLSDVRFEYGKGKGLYKISRSNVDSTNVITRLYLRGSERNIPNNYRGYNTRLLPNNKGYIDSPNKIKYGIIEATKIFEDIYPKYEGSVTETGADIYKFSDSAIPFNINTQLMPGVTAKLTFNSGQLSGYTFEINSFNNGEFYINKNQDEKAFELPVSGIQPAVGDKYVITDIIMPQTYIDLAEEKLNTDGLRYLNENHEPRVNYAIDIDPMYMKALVINIVLGNQITVSDASMKFDRPIRVTGYQRNINNTFKYSLDLSEVIAAQIVNRVIAEINNTKQVINRNKLSDPARTRLNWRTTGEVLSQKFDPDGFLYTDAISPITIDTLAVRVGAKSQQFTLKGIKFLANADGDANKFQSSSGQLIHLTINEGTETTWQVSASEYTGLSDTVDYYIYIKANRTNFQEATVVLDTVARKYDSDSSYWYFLVGDLFAVFQGIRVVATSYGFTFINGSTVTTGEIRSQDGQTYFNLDTGEIGGRIAFQPGSTGYANIEGAPPAGARIFNEQPTTPYTTDSYWNKEGQLYKSTMNRPSGPFVLSDWVIALIYDSTQTVIDGGLVSTGGLRVGQGNMINAGIDGAGTADTSVRFWAGATYSNRVNAPFRAMQNGDVVMTSGLIANGCKIGNWVISSGGIFNDAGNAYIIAREIGTDAGTFNEARIGSNVFPATTGAKGSAYFENTIPNPVGNNVAIYAKAANASPGFKSYAADLVGDVQITVGGLLLSGDLSLSRGTYMAEGNIGKTQNVSIATSAGAVVLKFVKGIYIGQ